MKPAPCFLVLMAAAVSGCATHHKLGKPRASLAAALGVELPDQAAQPPATLSERYVAQLLDGEVHAKLPTRLAVAKLRRDWYGQEVRLAAIDAEELEAWEKIVEGEKMIAGVQPVSSLAVDLERRGPSGVDALRVAAARLKCELLLVYLQTDGRVDNFNDAAALYWTFVGLWLVPGNVIEHRTVMQALLVDTRTGAILGTATGDSRLEQACPAALADITRDKLSKAAPAKAFADLQAGCKKLLREVVEAAQKHAAR